MNATEQLQSIRTTSSTLIGQYMKDCQAIGDSLQTNVQQIDENIRTIVSNWNRLLGKDKTMST